MDFNVTPKMLCVNMGTAALAKVYGTDGDSTALR